MRTIVESVLRLEARSYHLRFGCEDCAHFDPERRACAEGFPNAPHLGVKLEAVASLDFCKSFELV